MMSVFDIDQRPRFRMGISSVVLAVAFGLALGLTPTAATAQSLSNVLFHASGLSYSDSQVKEDGYTAGFYGTYGTGWKHLVEVGATRTRINFLDGWQLQQSDLSAAYNLFGARGSGRIGGHLVLSNDSLTDRGLVLFGGANVYKVGVWNVGGEVAWSSYPDYGDGLTVAQFSPTVGLTSTNASGNRLVGITLRGYYIHLSTETGLVDQDFMSAEASVSFTSGPLTLSGYAWGGEQAFAVRNAGFLAFNLSERHTGGYGGGLRWVLSPRSALSAGVYVERFEDLDFPGGAKVRTFSISLGFTL